MVRPISARRSRATLQPRQHGGDAVRGVWCVVILAACATPPRGDPQGDIAALLSRSASDWNRGDLGGFMSDYAHDSLTSYVSAGHVVYGWRKLFDRYQTTYFAPGKSRDSLAFEEVRVRPLAPELPLRTADFHLLALHSVTAIGPSARSGASRGNRTSSNA